VTAGERGAAKARTYQTAFNPADVKERSWLAGVLADFERVCFGAEDQTTFVVEDTGGRESAFNEGKRQAYLYLRRILAMTGEEIRVEGDRLDREEERYINAEVTRRLRDAA
jgi:hypothetical protein